MYFLSKVPPIFHTQNFLQRAEVRSIASFAFRASLETFSLLRSPLVAGGGQSSGGIRRKSWAALNSLVRFAYRLAHKAAKTSALYRCRRAKCVSLRALI